MCVCKTFAIAIRHSMLSGGHAEASPSPPPLPPPGRRLTLAGPDRELAWRGIHGAPRQPTEPTHSVCAGVPTPG